MKRRPLLGRLTYDRYGHLFPEIDKHAAEKLDVCGPLSSLLTCSEHNRYI